MKAWVEVWKPEGPELIPLEGRVSIGKDSTNHVALGWDATVSKSHAILEAIDVGWLLRDLGSRNGTFLNGERLGGERRLRHGDRIRVGKVEMVYRSNEPMAGRTATEAAEAPPELTRRERDVLVVLCRPVLTGTMFTEPASVRQIADALVITEGAVKKHLLSLYGKFGIYDEGERKRLQLANEAIQRGAVSVADLRAAAARGQKRSP